MLGPMGAVVMSVLKVMTPAEIERYSQGREAETEEVSKIAAGVESLGSGSMESSFNHQKQDQNKKDWKPPNDPEKEFGEAKIIPIRPPPEESAPVESEPESELEEMGIISGEKQHAIKEAASAREKSEQDSATIFLIKERQRLKKVKHRLNTNEAFKTYEVSSSIEFFKPEPEVDLDNPDKEDAIGSRGILINKKHY